jgi:hypothetical protein
LVIAWAAGLTVASGATAALWTAPAPSWCSSGGRPALTTALRDSWLQVAAGALIGLALIGLKLVLH